MSKVLRGIEPVTNTDTTSRRQNREFSGDTHVQQGEVTEFTFIGAGQCSEYQLAALQEISNARCIAIVDLDADRARPLCDQFEVKPTVW